jgi:rare lipoprotein A
MGRRKPVNSRTFVTTSLVFSLFAAQAVYPAPEQSYPRQETGIASYYSSAFNGRRTASGERFSNTALTAAHLHYPLGTRLRVTNLKNRRRVLVRVNDRGPFVSGRVISVTRRAARILRFEKAGLTEVKVAVVGSGKRRAARHRATRRVAPGHTA